MAVSDQIAQALQAADASGNTADAQQLAQAYAQQKALESQTQPQQSSQPPADRQGLSDSYYQSLAKGDQDGMNQSFKTLRENGLTLAPPSSQQIAIAKSALYPADNSNSVVAPVQEFALAAAHHLMNPVYGAAQLVGHGIGAIADNTLSPDNSVRQAIDTTNANTDNNLQQREQQYQNIVPNSGAATAGAVGGEIAPFLMEAPAKGLQLLGDGAAKIIPNAGNIAARLGKMAVSGAAQGGAVAALQPVTTGSSQGNLASLIAPNPSFASQKLGQIGTGMAVGGAVPLAAQGIGGAVNAARNISQYVTNPQGVAANQLGRVLGADQGTVNALSNPVSTVPGEVPTTAQTLGGTQALMAEKAFGNTPAGKATLTQAANDNNAARLAVVRGIAGDDSTLQAALDARKAATQPFIDANLSPATPELRFAQAQQPIQQALAKPMVRDADFQALGEANSIMQKVQNGSMQEDDALEQLNDLAASTKQGSPAYNALNQAIGHVNQNMVDPSSILKSLAFTKNATSLGQNPTVQKALTQIQGQIQGAQNINGLVPANMLDGIRQNASRILQANHDPMALVGSQEEAGIAPVKQQIVNTLNQSVPGYKDYLAAYAAHSQPINDMSAAQAILNPVDNGTVNSAGDPVLTLARLNQGMRSADNAQYGFSPKAQQQLQGVRDSLQRASMSNSISSPGSDTAFNLQSQPSKPVMSVLGKAAPILGAAIGEHAGGPVGAAVGAGAGALIDRGVGVINQRIQNAYAQGMRDPAVAKQMIVQYLRANQSAAPMILQRYPQWQALLAAPSAMATQGP